MTWCLSHVLQGEIRWILGKGNFLSDAHCDPFDRYRGRDLCRNDPFDRYRGRDLCRNDPFDRYRARHLHHNTLFKRYSQAASELAIRLSTRTVRFKARGTLKLLQNWAI